VAQHHGEVSLVSSLYYYIILTLSRTGTHRLFTHQPLIQSRIIILDYGFRPSIILESIILVFLV